MAFYSSFISARLRWALVVASFCLAPLTAPCADPVVLTVNQTPVTRDEFSFFMQPDRDGITPREQLLSKTVARVTREKVRQQLFQELGLMKATTFAEFLAQVESVNREREQAVNAGRIIYGPVRFTPLQFYGDWMAKLELQAQKQLATGRLAMTENELRIFYKMNQSIYRTTESSDWEIVTIQNANGLAFTNALVQMADRIFWRMKREANTDQICRESGRQAGVSVKIERSENLSSEHLDVLSADENNLAALSQLRPGYCLRLESKPGVIQLVRCVSRHASTVRPFEAVADLVQKKRLDQKYQALLDELARAAKVKTNPEVWDIIRRE